MVNRIMAVLMIFSDDVIFVSFPALENEGTQNLKNLLDFVTDTVGGSTCKYCQHSSSSNPYKIIKKVNKALF